MTEMTSIRLFVALSAALAVLGVGVPTALARPHASVSLGLPHTVNEGAPIPFSWTGSHLGRKHRLVIQRPEGTAHTWRTIIRLRSNSGSGELPGLALGKYRLRLADLSKHRVLAQQVVGIGVFGQVPFSTLFYGNAYNGVYATPSSSFPYVDRYEPGNFQSPSVAFTVEHNHCKSVHIAFVPGDHFNLGVGTVTLVQETRDPVSASADFDSIGSLDADLVPGQTWAVNTSYASEDGYPLIYINGYAICSSTESFF